MSKLLENMVRYRNERDFLREDLQRASNSVDSAGKMLQKLESKLKTARAELEAADTVIKSVSDQLRHIAPHPMAQSPPQSSTINDTPAATSTTTESRKHRAHALEQLNRLALAAVQHFMSVQSDCMRHKDQVQETERLLTQRERTHQESLRELQQSAERDFEVHKNELTIVVEERLRAALYDKTLAESRLEDTTYCLEALVAHTLRLQTQADDLLEQKKLLTALCAGYDNLREDVSDLAAGCVELNKEALSGKRELEYSPLLASVVRGNTAGMDGKVPSTPGVFHAGAEIRGWRIGLAQRGFDGHNIRYYLPSLRIVGIIVVASIRLRKLGDLHRRRKIGIINGDDGHGSDVLQLVFDDPGATLHT
jgi:chromosome segregation ATPase